MQPTVKVIDKGSGLNGVLKAVDELKHKRAYCGIPSTTAQRRFEDIFDMAVKRKPGSKKQKYLLGKLTGELINNAQLLYIHTNGSPMKRIPPRPVIEPAIRADGNRELINAELEEAAKAAFRGEERGVNVHMKRAGLLAQNAARAWFTDPRNGWPPNRPSTIRQKGSSRPLVDTGELRKSITYVVSEE